MSSDNYITISKSTFEVYEKCASCPNEKGNFIGKGKNLEDAIKVYEDWHKEMNNGQFGYYPIEYGIVFKD